MYVFGPSFLDSAPVLVRPCTLPLPTSLLVHSPDVPHPSLLTGPFRTFRTGLGLHVSPTQPRPHPVSDTREPVSPPPNHEPTSLYYFIINVIICHLMLLFVILTKYRNNNRVLFTSHLQSTIDVLLTIQSHPVWIKPKSIQLPLREISVVSPPPVLFI